MNDKIKGVSVICLNFENYVFYIRNEIQHMKNEPWALVMQASVIHSTKTLNP